MSAENHFFPETLVTINALILQWCKHRPLTPKKLSKYDIFFTLMLYFSYLITINYSLIAIQLFNMSMVYIYINEIWNRYHWHQHTALTVILKTLARHFFFHFANPQTGNNKIIRIIKMNIIRNKQLWNQKQRLYVLYLTETQNSLHVFLKTSNSLKQTFSILKNTFS